MSDSDRYFQFPLCFLAYGPEPKTRLDEIVSWCCVHRGEQVAAEMSIPELREHFNEHTINPPPAGMRMTDRDHLSLAAGMHALGINAGSASRIVSEADNLNRYLRVIESSHGRYPTVRIRTDLFWNALKGERPYRDFSVLCAVYSAIGAKEYPVRIIRPRIIAGALGYKSSSLMTPDALACRADKAQPLTTNQLRYTLDRLEADSLFVRVQASKRCVYFSHRMDRTELETKVLAMKTRRAVCLRDNRKSDRKLQEKIRDTIKVVKVANQSPRIHHNATTEQPPSHLEGTTLIKTVGIETVSKETISKETLQHSPCGQGVVVSVNAPGTASINSDSLLKVSP